MLFCNRRRLFAVVLLVFLPVLVTVIQQPFVSATTDTTGGTGSTADEWSGLAFAFPVTITGSGVVSTIGINFAGTQAGNVMVALYSAGSSKPAGLLTQSVSTVMSTTSGWQDVPVAAYTVSPGSYWLALELSVHKGVYRQLGLARSDYSKLFGSFDSTWSASSRQDTCCQENMRITYGATTTASTSSTTSTSSTVSTGPASYPFNVKAGTTQVVVTVSWTGSGTASVTIQGPGGIPTMTEAGGMVYDRTTIIVVGGSATSTFIHRVTFTLSPSPSSPETWTVTVTIGTSTYNVNVEVS
jgi:hypothetical protein